MGERSGVFQARRLAPDVGVLGGVLCVFDVVAVSGVRSVGGGVARLGGAVAVVVFVAARGGVPGRAGFFGSVTGCSDAVC